MTPDDFAPLIGALIAATGKKLETDDIEAWRRLLSDLPDEAIKAAMLRAACECEAFPSVALIRRLAAEATSGIVDTQGDTFARVAEAMRRFGPCLPCVPKCDRCREDVARRHIGEIGWKAVRAMGGWSSVCNTRDDGMATLRAQYRDAYRAAAEREDRNRRLPEHLRPAIDNTPVAGLPEPQKELPALPAPAQPTEEQIERAKTLRIFRDPVEATAVSEEELERRRAAQVAAAQRMIRSTGMEQA